MKGSPCCSEEDLPYEAAGVRRLKALFENLEPPFQLKLLAGLFTTSQQRRARSRSLLPAELRAACSTRAGVAFPWARLLPETVAGQEAVFERGAHHLLEV